jgi:TolB-like protein
MSMLRFAFGPFLLDADRGTLTRDGLPVAVGNRGMALLTELLKANYQVVGKAVLMDAAWPGAIVEESNLSVQIAALRKLLGPSPAGGEWIATVPRAGYRFVGIAGLGEQASELLQRGVPTDLTSRPSIAVLPFTNVSGDKEQEYLADGITEDIITALARFRWFSVMARNSSFIYKAKPIDVTQVADELGVRYLLEGSLRKSGQRVRISAQLIDATTGVHLWADRYELEFTEVFAIQDEIAERVAGAIEPELLKTESILAVARHTGNMTAWDLVRQGTWRFHQVTRPTHVQARELFREACRLDPHLPEAYIWRARVSAGVIAYGWSDDPSADRQEGLEAALRAIHLDEKNPYSHYALAIVSAYSDELEQAIRAAEKAVELTPSFALGHLVLGMVQLFSGRATDAIAPLQHGLKLNPHDPQNPVWFNLLALAQLFTGQAGSALETTSRALKVWPDWRPTLETMACCYGLLDKWEEARRCVHHMAQLQRPPSDALAPLKNRNPDWWDRMKDLLRKADWRENA